MVITFILGAFIDWVGIIFVLIPILAPIIPKLGFNPLWFAMMIIVNLQMSFLTPPFAYAMFFLKGTADPALGIETKDIICGMLPFVGIIAIGLVFTSGAIPLNPADGSLVPGGIGEQTRPGSPWESQRLQNMLW
jgi:TRAP-type mannitol/chloroaromatic compound transport system permease large subunit